MVDVFSSEKRSSVMAAIKGKGNKETELIFLSILKVARIKGWRRNIALYGRPDFVFRAQKVAIFIDGCFWHGCVLHSKPPKSNAEYWSAKIARNQARDLEVNKYFHDKGWQVLRYWAHDLKGPAAQVIVHSLRRALKLL